MKLSDRWYTFLKWLALICLPALSLLLTTILPLYGVSGEVVKTVTITINALGVFIGTLIGVSQITIAQESASEEFFETETEDDLPLDEEDAESEEA